MDPLQAASEEAKPDYRRLAELAPVGLFQTDAAGNCLFVNKRWCEIAGMEPSAALGQGWLSALHPEDRDRVSIEWYEAARGGYEFASEYRFRTPDGKVTWLQGTAAATYSDTGEVSGYIGTVTDISKRKAALETLAAKESQLRLVTDHAPVFIANCSSDRRFKFVNRSYAARLGLAPEEIIGKPVREVLGEEAFNSFAAHVDRVLAGHHVEYEVEIPYATIGPRVMHCLYVPEKDTSGHVIGWVAAITDVTERRRAEKTLQDAQERFARFMQHLPGLAWIKDEDGKYIYANDAALAAFQLAPNQLYGRTDDQVFPPTIAAAFKENDQKAVSSSQGWHQTVESLPHRDGQIHHSIVSKFAIHGSDTARPMVGGIAIDITDRLRMEEKLRRSEQRLSMAQVAGNIGTFDWNVRTNQVEWSSTEEALFGLSEGTFGGTFEHWEQLLHPADRDAALRACQRAANEGADLDIEFRIIRPDGTIRWITAQAQVLRDEEGSPSHVIGVNVDVTERKQTEEALREADRRKDEFLATLAHELRNPLAPIRNSLHLLRMTVDDARIRPLHEMMERQVNHMIHLIDDLLEISRITSGKITLRKAKVEVAAILRNAVDTSRPLVEQAGHELRVELPERPLLIDADDVRIAQVVANLLNNATRYTESGGHIVVSARECDGSAVISVRDDGIGIEPGMLARVFEMFAQVDPDHKRSHGGLGIGLALAKTLIELHHGTIEAYSQGLGHGSEFTIWLPLAEDSVEQRELSLNGGLPHGKNVRRILVVDDNHDAALSLAMLLRTLGNEVEVATNGETALQAVNSFRPSILFLDLGMPVMSGYEIAAQVRQRFDSSAMRLIALTGWGQEEDRRRTREAGFQHHLVKPVDMATLVQVLTQTASPETRDPRI